MTKVTSKEYKLFKDYHSKWCDKLGIKNWSIHYSFEHLDDNYAQTYMDTDGMVSSTTLSDYWDDTRPMTNAAINRLALHEALHLLIRPLTSQAESRYTTQDNILSIEHSIIRQLENIF